MSQPQKETALDALKEEVRPILWHLGAVSFFINLLVLPVSIYSLQVLDRVMATGSLSTLFWLTITMIILFVAAGGLQFLRSMMMQRLGDWGHEEITKAVLPLTLTKGARSGSQTVRDAGLLKQLVGGNAITAIMDAPWAILYLAVLFMIHTALGVLVTFGLVLLIGMAWLSESMMRLPMRHANAEQIKGLQDIEFASRNADVIEAMGMRDTLLKRWHTLQARVNAFQAKANGRSAFLQGVTKFVRLSLQILVTGVAAWLALAGDLTIGAIIAASILASRALAPFESAIGSWKALTDGRSAYERLQTALKEELRKEAISLPTPEGKLAAENLTYVAEQTKQPILQKVNFQIEPGECLGIIGHSGSGKSTLARLIAGILKPTSGVVRLDSGDVYSWPRTEFGAFTGYLPQDVELFGGTVKDNIARLQDDVDPKAIIHAAQLANAHELILRLPNGYDTDIGANGATLSAGQRQRIGLARAFFGEPKLLILDEPDANLDDTGKAALIEAILRAKQKKITVVLISHRKTVLSYSDKLLGLKNGIVEAFAPTEQLMPKAKIASIAGTKE